MTDADVQDSIMRLMVVAISIHTIGALMIHGSRKDINKLLQDNE